MVPPQWQKESFKGISIHRVSQQWGVSPALLAGGFKHFSIINTLTDIFKIVKTTNQIRCTITNYGTCGCYIIPYSYYLPPVGGLVQLQRVVCTIPSEAPLGLLPSWPKVIAKAELDPSCLAMVCCGWIPHCLATC